MLNINKTKTKTYNKEGDKMNLMTNKIKEKSSTFNFSPSEFAFGFQNCQKCYYDKKVNGIELKTYFPPVFNKIDSLQKKFYHGKSSKIVTDELEEGEIISNYNNKLKSEVLYDLKERPFTMTGYIDGYIKHKDSFTIVDFKTTNINEKNIDTYATQLQSYALMMERPKKGSLKLTPIKRLGIFCFDPSEITETNGNNCNMQWNTKWFEIPRDDKDLIGYITKVQDLLYSKETPESGSTCGICNFRNLIK
jgi:hypothetical protein